MLHRSHSLAFLFHKGCLVGTLTVALSDRDSDEKNENPFLGDCLTVVSVMIYAVYAVLVSKWISDCSQTQIFLSFGFMGLVNLFIFSCVGCVLFVFHQISFELSSRSLLLIFTKGIFDNVLSDIFWINAVFLIGPTVATVGLSLQWPIAIIVDALFFSPPWMQNALPLIGVALGSALIFVGFVGINVPTDIFQQLNHPYKALDNDDDLKIDIKTMDKV